MKIDPARSRLIGAFIDSYLKLTAEENRQYEREFAEIAPQERKSTMALVSSWEQRGISQGKEGLVERQIRKRLGAIPAWAQERLGKLSADDLDSLGEALLDFNDESDLKHWLARNPPN